MVQLIKDLDGSDHLSPCPDGTPRKLMWTRDPEKEGNIPLTIQKSDGAFTYDTSDLATLRCGKMPTASPNLPACTCSRTLMIARPPPMVLVRWLSPPAAAAAPFLL